MWRQWNREYRGVLHGVGCCVVKEWVEIQEPAYPVERVACLCGREANYVRRREAVSLTLHGKVSYRRAYSLGGWALSRVK